MSTFKRLDRSIIGERALPKLATRGVHNLHHFHLAKTSKGYLCLDFDRWFFSLDDFCIWAVKKLKTMPSDEICSSAPEDLWRQFMDDTRFTFVQTFALPPEVAQVRGARRVTVVEGEFA